MSTEPVPSDVVRSLFHHLSTYEQTRGSFERVLAELKREYEREEELGHQLQDLLQDGETSLWISEQLNNAEYVDAEMQRWFQALQAQVDANDSLIRNHPELVVGHSDRKIGILQRLTRRLTQLHLCPVCEQNPCVCAYRVTRTQFITPSESNTYAMTGEPPVEAYARWNGLENTLQMVLKTCSPKAPDWYKMQAMSAWGIRSTAWRSLTDSWTLSMRVRLEAGNWKAGCIDPDGPLTVERVLRIYLHYVPSQFSPTAPPLDYDIVLSLYDSFGRLGRFIQDETGTHITFDSNLHPFLWESETDSKVTDMFSRYVRKEVVLKVEFDDDSAQTTLTWTDPQRDEVLFSEQTSVFFQDYDVTYVPVCFALNRSEMYLSSFRLVERQLHPQPRSNEPQSND